MIETQEKIAKIVDDVKRFSEKERTEPSQEQIDQFLDKINWLKDFILEDISRLKSITTGLEDLTWITEFDEKDVEDLRYIVNICKDIHSTLVKYYIKLKSIFNGMPKQELSDFKLSIDDFREAYTDINSKFFVLPNLQDFKEGERILFEI